MKTFTKAKPKAKGKGKAKVIDGRANPAPAGGFEAFAANASIRKLPAKLAQQIHSTPMRHQSGKGIRGYRQDLNGVSKTAVIRWLAANGFDRDSAETAIANLFKMKPGVFTKHWGYGLNGVGNPVELDKTSVETLKRAGAHK